MLCSGPCLPDWRHVAHLPAIPILVGGLEGGMGPCPRLVYLHKVPPGRESSSNSNLRWPWSRCISSHALMPSTMGRWRTACPWGWGNENENCHSDAALPKHSASTAGSDLQLPKALQFWIARALRNPPCPRLKVFSCGCHHRHHHHHSHLKLKDHLHLKLKDSSKCNGEAASVVRLLAVSFWEATWRNLRKNWRSLCTAEHLHLPPEHLHLPP